MTQGYDTPPVTTPLQRCDGRTVHARQATRPEPHQQKIAETLHLSANPGGTYRTVICKDLVSRLRMAYMLCHVTNLG